MGKKVSYKALVRLASELFWVVLAVILFLYHLQNLVGKASHSLDSWVTVLLVYVMKGDDRNLIGLADLFY